MIDASQQRFIAGERELRLGHLDRARIEFDRAVEMLLESPYGARTDARLREHFDRLVDRINAYEVTALAQGDGFAEKTSEPASIDELLKIATFPKPAPGAETEKVVKADLAATEHDVPIPQNERVLGYVELFQGRLRDYIHESLTRGTKYLPMIQSVFRAEGMPLDLAYIPVIESGFKTNALSKASAKGPWQFMRATATEQGLKTDWYVDERSDPEKATIAAARYLKTLHDLFDGDWHLVLAAYNGGLGRVQRAMKRSGQDDFWTLSTSSRYLPRETREYVPLILAAIIVAKNPAQYGFDITAEEPIAYEKVLVPKRHRPSPGRGVDRPEHRRDSGAQSRAPALDDARQVRVRAQGPAGHGESLRGAAGVGLAKRARRADLVHREAGRDDCDDRPQAQGQPGRSGGSQPTLDQVPDRGRPGAGDSARPGHAAGDQQPAVGPDRSGVARHFRRRSHARRGAARARGATSGEGGERLGEDGHLPGEARRHALRDRPAVRYDCRQDQEPEPAAVEPDHAGHAPEDRLGNWIRDRRETAHVACLARHGSSRVAPASAQPRTRPAAVSPMRCASFAPSSHLLACVRTAAVFGIEACLVQVEVDVSFGLPAFQMVGLPDASVRESRDRVRSAIRNSGFEFPPHRVTVNLAPADIRKAGSSFDLPIALGVLAAAGHITRRDVAGVLLLGELSLDGGIQTARGVLPIAAAARRHRCHALLLPHPNSSEAAVVEGLELYPVRSLAEAVSALNDPVGVPRLAGGSPAGRACGSGGIRRRLCRRPWPGAGAPGARDRRGRRP